MFYGFCLRNGLPALAAPTGFKASHGAGLRRPTLVQCFEDMLCAWRPSDEEALGVRAAGFRVLLIKLKDRLLKIKPFGNSHCNYSMLLAPIANDLVESLGNVGIPQLFELADISTKGDQFFGTFLSIIGIISIVTLGSFLLKLAY